MDSSDAFTRAALYQTCKKSKILSNIDVENVDIQTLRALVNQHNTIYMREFPILISKYLVKFGLSFVVEKFPNMRTYINPENILIQIEDDELVYLQTHEAQFQMNIYMIVVKNIAVSVLGATIQSIRDQLNPNSTLSEYAKIQVKSVEQPIPEQVVPKTYTNAFSSDPLSSPRLISPLPRSMRPSKGGSLERDTNVNKYSDGMESRRISRRDELQVVRHMHRDRLTSSLRYKDNSSECATSIHDGDEVDDIEETETERRSLLGRRSSISKFNDSTMLLHNIDEMHEKYLEYASSLSSPLQRHATNEWLNINSRERQPHYVTIETTEIGSKPKILSNGSVLPSEFNQTLTINESEIMDEFDSDKIKKQEIKMIDSDVNSKQRLEGTDTDEFISIIEVSDFSKTTNELDGTANMEGEFMEKSASVASEVSMNTKTPAALDQHKTASSSDMAVVPSDKRMTISFSDDEDD